MSVKQPATYACEECGETATHMQERFCADCAQEYSERQKDGSSDAMKALDTAVKLLLNDEDCATLGAVLEGFVAGAVEDGSPAAGIPPQGNRRSLWAIGCHAGMLAQCQVMDLEGALGLPTSVAVTLAECLENA